MTSTLNPSMGETAGFFAVQRPCDLSPVYLHNEKPVWVVQYDATEVRPEHWQGYYAVAPVPKGRMPWSVDNRRIGTERGFPSLEAAITASVSHADVLPETRK